MTFLAALRHNRVEALWFIVVPIKGEGFHLSIDRVLAPPLRPATSAGCANEDKRNDLARGAIPGGRAIASSRAQ